MTDEQTPAPEGPPSEGEPAPPEGPPSEGEPAAPEGPPSEAPPADAAVTPATPAEPAEAPSEPEDDDDDKPGETICKMCGQPAVRREDGTLEGHKPFPEADDERRCPAGVE